MEITLIEQLTFTEDEINTLKKASNIIRQVYEEVNNDTELENYANDASSSLDIFMEGLEFRGCFR